jgi:hypothetical protein
MKKIKKSIIGRKVSIDVSALYSKYGETLSNSFVKVTKSDDETYYDLKTKRHGTVCMDGETCIINDQDDKLVYLTEVDSDVTFSLTIEEFLFAAILCSAKQ